MACVWFRYTRPLFMGAPLLSARRLTDGRLLSPYVGPHCKRRLASFPPVLEKLLKGGPTGPGRGHALSELHPQNNGQKFRLFAYP